LNFDRRRADRRAQAVRFDSCGLFFLKGAEQGSGVVSCYSLHMMKKVTKKKVTKKKVRKAKKAPKPSPLSLLEESLARMAARHEAAAQQRAAEEAEWKARSEMTYKAQRAWYERLWRESEPEAEP
jgi:hypothetical protein